MTKLMLNKLYSIEVIIERGIGYGVKRTYKRVKAYFTTTESEWAYIIEDAKEQLRPQISGLCLDYLEHDWYLDVETLELLDDSKFCDTE